MGAGQLIADNWHREAATAVIRNTVQPRRWGMRVTVFDDASPVNNGEWVLSYNLVNTNRNDNQNWLKVADIGDVWGGGGGGGISSADNGLSLSTPTNVQLGGAIITDTYVTSATDNAIAFGTSVTGTIGDPFAFIELTTSQLSLQTGAFGDPGAAEVKFDLTQSGFDLQSNVPNGNFNIDLTGTNAEFNATATRQFSFLTPQSSLFITNTGVNLSANDAGAQVTADAMGNVALSSILGDMVLSASNGQFNGSFGTLAIDVNGGFTFGGSSIGVDPSGISINTELTNTINAESTDYQGRIRTYASGMARIDLTIDDLFTGMSGGMVMQATAGAISASRSFSDSGFSYEFYETISVSEGVAVSAEYGVVTPTGEAKTTYSITGIEFITASTPQFAIGNAGELLDQTGSAGTLGQVITSAGPGAPWSWAPGGGGGGVSFGLQNEIPYMNATNNDFDYESTFEYDPTIDTLTVSTTAVSGSTITALTGHLNLNVLTPGGVDRIRTNEAIEIGINATSGQPMLQLGRPTDSSSQIRTISTAGAGASESLTISSRGGGNLTLSQGLLLFSFPSATNRIQFSSTASTLGVQNAIYTLQGPGGNSGVSNNGGSLTVRGGNGFVTSGDGNGGSVLIQSGQRRVAGLGVDGNVTLDALTGFIILANIPTASAGLPAGAVWNNAGVLNIV